MSNASINSMKWASFVSQQLETIIESITNPVISSFNSSNLTMKLITINDYAHPSVSGDFKSPYGTCLFAFDF
jgi:hypothetical protein